MSELTEFARVNPWLTFFVFWLVCYTVAYPFRIAFHAWNRYLRSKNIQAHGYPTNPRMDADGDIIHPESEP